jgi:hypothetical protein
MRWIEDKFGDHKEEKIWFHIYNFILF